MTPGSSAPAPSTPPRTPKGMHDVPLAESVRWEALLARSPAGSRGPVRLRHTPIFEDVRVFRRGIGEDSDVVGKEMYEFEDRGGRSWPCGPRAPPRWFGPSSSTSRPPVEGVVRHAGLPLRAPPGGRYRQHHQLGVEALGPEDPDLDVEVIALAARLLPASDCALDAGINSMGTATAARLRGAARRLPGRTPDQLCDEHRARLVANPLRVLDCKRPSAGPPRRTPPASSTSCATRAAHFARVRAGLDALGIAHRSSPGWCGASTTTRAPPSSSPPTRSSRPERRRRGRPLRRAGRDAGGGPDAGDRIRDRDRAAAAGL